MTTYQEALDSAETDAEFDRLMSQQRAGHKQPEFGYEEIHDPDERVPLYSMIDGSRRMVPLFALQKTLSKRIPGTTRRAFVTEEQRHLAPVNEPGNIKCWLHPEHPRAAEFRQAGITGITCMSEHLASEYSARIHMEHRHSLEWKVLNEYLLAKREEEERAMRELQTQVALQALAQQPKGKNGAG